MRKIQFFLINVFFILLIPFLIIYTVAVRQRYKQIIWGPIPMINYKYWSEAMKLQGCDSITLVSSFYSIYNKKDFDIYYDDIIPKWLGKFKSIKYAIAGPIFSYFYVVKYAKLINISFIGGFLGNTPIWFIENLLYKLAGIKVVVTAYGGDFYKYSELIDQSLKHALLMSYPKMAIEEELISKKVKYWSKHADAIISAFQLDGLGRWSCLPVNMITISNDLIIKNIYKKENRSIKIVHAPNHRGFKGTEFIIDAIEKLKTEGYKIDFILLENIKNEEVIRILREEADILVEQIITGYALNAIEGMANGVAVLSNITNDYYQVLRRYSYLNECPILSTNPENIKENLRLLIENKELREELGRLGVDYVKKYHSEETAQYMYGKIYNQLLNRVDEDSINMFHPLKSEYNKKNYIKTPLIDNQYIDSQIKKIKDSR